MAQKLTAAARIPGVTAINGGNTGNTGAVSSEAGVQKLTTKKQNQYRENGLTGAQRNMDDRHHATFVRLWTAFLAAVAAVLTLHPEHETDPFWHMTLGRAVLEHGSRTIPEPNSFLTLGQAIVVPDWLWDVFIYSVYRGFGETVLTLIPALFAALAALAVVQLLRSVAPSARPGALALVSAVVVVLILARMRLRPQAAFLVLLPTYLCLVQAYVNASGRRALALGAGIVVAQLLWVQLHGSFVLGPAIFATFAIADSFRQRAPGTRVRHELVFIGLLLVFLTGSYGTDISHYILSHSGGDGKRHVADMVAPTWAGFDPSQNVLAAGYLGLLFFSLVACLRHGRHTRLEHVAMSVLGIALFLTATRFLSAAAVLTAPLAIQGAQIFLQPFRSRTVVGVGIVTLISLLVVRFSNAYLDIFGPFGATGFSPSGYPYAANAYLRDRPKPIPVLTDYGTGESLTFWQQGNVYAYVDSRTLLHFDDTQFAVARDLAGSSRVLTLITDRYGLDTAVVKRNGAECQALARTWHPVVVEPYYTTFSRIKTAPTVTTLAPCSAYFATPRMCERGGAKFDADMAILQKYVSQSFYGYLKAEHILRCGGDISKVPALLPSNTDAWYYRGQVEMTRALWLLKADRLEEAAAILAPQIRKGDLDAYSLAEPWIRAGRLEPKGMYALLADFARVWDDRTPLNVREALTLTCMRLARTDCVQFHGTRAALQGSKNATEILRWLATHHPDARERLDAQSWLSVIERRDAEDKPIRNRPQL